MRRCARFLTVLVASLSMAGSVCIAHPTQQSSNPPKSGAKQDDAQTHPTPDEQLQQAIDSAGNDRAALVRNLEAFLQKYPEAPQRSRIYRALVESNIQLRDNARAMNYAERIIALNPEDISMTLIAIQLLEQSGDEAGLKRAGSYSP